MKTDILATRMGVRAVEALLAGENDVMVGLDGRQIVAVSLVKSPHRSVSWIWPTLRRLACWPARNPMSVVSLDPGTKPGPGQTASRLLFRHGGPTIRGRNRSY